MGISSRIISRTSKGNTAVSSMNNKNDRAQRLGPIMGGVHEYRTVSLVMGSLRLVWVGQIDHPLLGPRESLSYFQEMGETEAAAFR